MRCDGVIIKYVDVVLEVIIIKFVLIVLRGGFHCLRLSLTIIFLGIIREINFKARVVNLLNLLKTIMPRIGRMRS